MLQAHALVTLAELSAYIPTEGVLDAKLFARREGAINRASSILEDYCDRRLVYRAPPEVAGSQNIKAEVVLAPGAVVGFNQPTSPGRTLILTLIDAEKAVVSGTLTVTGTVAGVGSVTEVFQLGLGALGTSAGQGAGGLLLHGTKFFTAISAIDVAGLNGDVGSNAKVRIGSSEGYVEFHSPGCRSAQLWTLERPVRELLRVNEDADRAYADATLLVSGADYQLRPNDGTVTRLAGAGLQPRAWAIGFRSVRAIYSAGYFTSAAVPQAIKDVVLELAATILKQQERNDWGVNGRSDAIGNYTRFGPATLTEEMKEQLVVGNHRRMELAVTGSRDFDLEAA